MERIVAGRQMNLGGDRSVGGGLPWRWGRCCLAAGRPLFLFNCFGVPVLFPGRSNPACGVPNTNEYSMLSC